MLDKIPVKEVLKVVNKPMSNEDINKYLPNSKILKYEELYKYKNIKDILTKDKDYCIILFMQTGYMGHWICIVRNGDNFYYFDSYGNPIDEFFKWNDESMNKTLNQPYPYIKDLLNGTNAYYNGVKYQEIDKNIEISTCGRHCIFFILNCLNYNKDLLKYYKFMNAISKKYKIPYDLIVSQYIDKFSTN